MLWFALLPFRAGTREFHVAIQADLERFDRLLIYPVCSPTSNDVDFVSNNTAAVSSAWSIHRWKAIFGFPIAWSNFKGLHYRVENKLTIAFDGHSTRAYDQLVPKVYEWKIFDRIGIALKWLKFDLLRIIIQNILNTEYVFVSPYAEDIILNLNSLSTLKVQVIMLNRAAVQPLFARFYVEYSALPLWEASDREDSQKRQLDYLLAAGDTRLVHKAA